MNKISKFATLIARLSCSNSEDLSTSVFELASAYKPDLPNIGDVTKSIDSAIKFASQFGLKPNEVMSSAITKVGRDHALHVRYWDESVDGDYGAAVAKEICIVVLSKIEMVV